MSTEAKVADVRACTNAGASELDIAVDIAAVKSGNWNKVTRDFWRSGGCGPGKSAGQSRL